MNKQLTYYIDLICEKIDVHADVFVKRIEALKQGDVERVDFIEKMMLEPLSEQITYLAKRASASIEKRRQNG